ncbi:uncharacterized protein LOC144110631 [Amblyomma americanum]
MDTLCGEQHRCGRSYPGDFDSEKEDLVSENSACESEEGMVTADPIVTVLPGENTKKQLHQSAHCSRSFIKKDPIEPHLLTQTGTDRIAFITSTRQCLRTALSIDRAVRVSVLLLAVGVTTLGVFNYLPWAADWLTVGCKITEPGAQFSRATSGLVTADPKLRVLSGENMSQQLHQSPHCSQRFTKKNCQDQHLLTLTDDRPYKCNHCGKIFTQKISLIHHIRIHTGERPYKCNHCDSSFSRKGHLDRHLRTHTGERPYKCDHCGNSFAQKETLVAHLRTHTGERPYNCDHCDSSFAHKCRLVQHLRTHTGERPYNCDHCGNSFAEKGTLVNHLHTHTGERPFQCQLCPMAFNRSTALARHVRAHKSERPYQCQFCTKTFKEKWDLKRHENKHVSKTTVPQSFDTSSQH